MHSSTALRRVATTIFCTALIAAVLPLFSAPARAGEPHTDEGEISSFSPVAPGATEGAFLLSCPEMPDTQGQDGYVFVLPEEFPVEGSTTKVTGSNAANSYDLDLVFYGSDCGFLDQSSTSEADETAETPAGTRFVVVNQFAGTNTTVTLTVTPAGSGVDPTPTDTPTETPTETPTTTPPPEGERGIYPVVPNDPLFPAQNVILGGQWGMRKINAPQAWSEPRATGHGIRVGVIDSGVDLDHEDLSCPGKIDIVPGANSTNDEGDGDDINGHGTHVAGIVGACTNNNTGVVGVAPDATLLPIRVFSDTDEDVNSVARGIRNATDGGAHVINMSLSIGIGAAPVGGGAIGLLPGLLPEIDRALEYAASKGVVVVAAAGNDSYPFCEYPALAEDLICVGSTDPRDLKSWYSNFPIKINPDDFAGPAVVAPGGTGQVFCDFHAENILSTYPVEKDNCNEGFAGYRGLEGTSMASPHVAGVATLVYDRIGGGRSTANRDVVIDAILESAVDLYSPGYDPASGYGRVDALAAVRAVEAVDPTPTETAARVTELAFTESSPRSGAYSEEAEVSARLTDDAGAPLADRDVVFTFYGAEVQEISTTTDESGTAHATISLDDDPAGYQLTVDYDGIEGVERGSSESIVFNITRADSSLTLESAGKGSKRTLTATLVASGGSGQALKERTVFFYADDNLVGEAETDEHGRATLGLPAGRKGNGPYEARFQGDQYYKKSSGTA